MKKILTIAAASGLALLMSAPVFAVQDGRYQTQTTVVNGRTTTQGHITMLSREGNQYRIQLDNGGYNYYVPMSLVRQYNLQVGDLVTIGGVGRADGMTVDVVNPNSPYYQTTNAVTGIVQSTNRHLSYITVRDAATGQRFKVDVRNMDTRRSVNVWRLRPGDRVIASGGWENRNTFNASTVNF